jgi:hypothetical protein
MAFSFHFEKLNLGLGIGLGWLGFSSSFLKI